MALVRELRPGLWHWQAPHPWWKEGTPWARDVSSYALDDGERLVLFDPLAVPGELLELAAEREPVIALTAPWHERDARDLIARLAAVGVALAAVEREQLQDLLADAWEGKAPERLLERG